jgi:hypothetical protein
MAENFVGKVVVASSAGQSTVVIEGDAGNLSLGGGGQDGDLTVKDGSGKLRAELRGASGQLFLRDPAGKARSFIGSDGFIRLWGADGVENVTVSEAGISARDNQKKLRAELRAESGQIFLRDGDAKARSFLGGDGRARMWNAQEVETVMIEGDGGDVVLRDGHGRDRIVLHGDDGSLTIRSSNGQQVFRLDSGDGRFHLRNWTIEAPDYVFSPDYPLRTLESLSAYIAEHQHLPEVPSAGEIQRDGVEVGSFAMTLLRKVEELTLYVLRQEAAIDALKARVAELEGAGDA